MTEFTKAELYIIEREFDRLASQSVAALGQFLKNVSEHKENLKLHIDVVLLEHYEAYDLFRSISARCAALSRGEACCKEVKQND